MRSTAARSTVSIAGSVGIAGSSSHTPMRRPLSVVNAAGGSSSDHAPWRAGSGPASTDSSRSRSAALRAIGPNTLMSASVVPPPTLSR